VRSVLAVWLLWTVLRHMSLLLTEETPSFCHELFLLFFAKGVSGTDGVYVHCIWVARGRTSSLSALSKSTLPLVSCAQTPLISHLRAEGEDGFLGEILSHLVLSCLLPLCHSFWPNVPVHDCIQGPWSQPGVEGINCSGVTQLPACFRHQGVKRHDVVIN
jgi:hypothetical protein